jgi:16S rRNA (adenine1518-N6/adenine1519-N6)-dimethyltransferase
MALSPQIIKDLCARYDLTPSKAYGQNYLVSDAPIKAMLESAKVRSTDTVIEIGPGFGILTFELLKAVKEVIAFEIEQKLRPYWEENQQKFPHLQMIWGNVLTTAKIASFPTDRPYKVVANVPYQITSDIIRLCVESVPPPEAIVLMVQKEVAERMIAKPGDMSLLALSVQYYGRVEKVMGVSHGSFWPSPKVDSAVIAIYPEARDTEEAKRVFMLARAGFSHKRKMVWGNISSQLKLDEVVVKEALVSIGKTAKARAEELSVGEWRALAQFFPHLST